MLVSVGFDVVSLVIEWFSSHPCGVLSQVALAAPRRLNEEALLIMRVLSRSFHVGKGQRRSRLATSGLGLATWPLLWLLEVTERMMEGQCAFRSMMLSWGKGQRRSR